MTRPGARVSLRSPWMLLSSALGLLTLTIGSTYFTTGPSASGTTGVDAFGYAIGAVFVPAGAWTMIRALFMRVVASSNGVQVRGFFRTRTYPSETIADVSTKTSAGATGPTRVPTLTLTDGADVYLNQLSAYTFRQPTATHPADRRTTAIRDALHLASRTTEA